MNLVPLSLRPRLDSCRVSMIVLGILACIIFEVPALGAQDQEIEVTSKFTGRIADPQLAEVKPESGWLQNDDDWKKLWQSWRPNEPLPEIDFDSQIVLVETTPGPNLLFANILKLTNQGDLEYELAGSLAAGPGFGYLVMVVPKAGILSIKGQPLNGKTADRAKTADRNQMAEGNSNELPKSPVQPPSPTPPKTTTKNQPVPKVTVPVGKPGIDPNTEDREFVNVEMVGRVRTQFQSVGADTTGTLVAADGIVWELDLQGDPTLLDSARQLGDSLARISGRLKMERQRGSLDGRVRWIVQVQRFEPLAAMGSIPRANHPGDPNVSEPTEMRSAKKDPQHPPASSERLTARPNNPEPESPSITTPRDAPTPPASFKRLSIVTSDGQTQTIDAAGNVDYDVPARGVSNKWLVDPTTLAKLHRFIADTDWERIPKVTRSQSNDPNEIGYTISIETPRSVTRIYVDRSAVADQSSIQQFFGIVSEMAQKR